MVTGAVKRVGKSRYPITEVELDELHPLHSVPRTGVPPNHIDDMANSIRSQGYNLAKAIPVVRMPDGRLVTFGGHHRVKAMQNLGEKRSPPESRIGIRWQNQFKINGWDFFLT